VEDVISKNDNILVINSTRYNKEKEVEAVEQLSNYLKTTLIERSSVKNISGKNNK
jgi:hypothetical protein